MTEEFRPHTTTNAYEMTCACCGVSITLSVSPSSRFYDLSPARGWEWDGVDAGWHCRDCAQARRQRERER